jgi:hypothetical protein
MLCGRRHVGGAAVLRSEDRYHARKGEGRRAVHAADARVRVQAADDTGAEQPGHGQITRIVGRAGDLLARVDPWPPGADVLGRFGRLPLADDSSHEIPRGVRHRICSPVVAAGSRAPGFRANHNISRSNHLESLT